MKRPAPEGPNPREPPASISNDFDMRYGVMKRPAPEGPNPREPPVSISNDFDMRYGVMKRPAPEGPNPREPPASISNDFDMRYGVMKRDRFLRVQTLANHPHQSEQMILIYDMGGKEINFYGSKPSSITIVNFRIVKYLVPCSSNLDHPIRWRGDNV
nr:histone-lysine N-methyltransferase 2E-like [Ipomoea batatas]